MCNLISCELQMNCYFYTELQMTLCAEQGCVSDVDAYDDLGNAAQVI